jgi:hypothetical protein
MRRSTMSGVGQKAGGRYTGFGAEHRIAAGGLVEVARACKAYVDGGGDGRVVIFDDETGRLVEVSLRGSPEDVEERARSAGKHPGGNGRRARGRGRPRLGVVAKEVTLLPRHWAWLSAQRGSASATLRRLVDEARRTHEGRDRVRRAQDAAYRFMSVKLGNEPGYEEAMRALYACNRERFEAESEAWPEELRDYCMRLAEEAFTGDDEEGGDDEAAPLE